MALQLLVEDKYRMSAAINSLPVGADFYRFLQQSAAAPPFHQDEFSETFWFLFVEDVPVPGKLIEQAFLFHVRVSASTLDDKIADDEKSRWRFTAAPALQSCVENKCIPTIKVFQTLFWDGRVAIGKGVEFWVEMHKNISHLLFASGGKILNQLSSVPTLRVAIRSPQAVAVGINRNEFKRTVGKNRPKHSAGTRIYANA